MMLLLLEKEKRRELTRKDLLDYLVKMTDRELSRQQRNGMTIWALLGAVAVVSFYMIDLIPKVEIEKVLYIATSTLNFIIVMWYCFYQFLIFEKKILLEYRAKKKLFQSFFIQVLTVASLIVLNINIISNSNFGIINILFILIYLLNFCCVFLYTFKLEKSFKQNIVMIKPKEFWYYYFKIDKVKELRITLMVAIYAFGGIVLIYRDYFINGNSLDNMKFSFLSLSLIWLIIQIIYRYEGWSDEQYILTQERELITAECSLEELYFNIKLLFNDADIKDWVRYKSYVLCMDSQNIIEKYNRYLLGLNSLIKEKSYRLAEELNVILTKHLEDIKIIELEEKSIMRLIENDENFSVVMNEFIIILKENKKVSNQILLEIKEYLRNNIG